MSDYEGECKRGMAKVIGYLKDEFRGVRTGRATSGLVEHIKIEVPSYGSTMELRELASITAPEPSTLRSEERRVGKEGRSRWSPYH